MFKNADVANGKQKLIAANQLNTIDIYVLSKIGILQCVLAEID